MLQGTSLVIEIYIMATRSRTTFQKRQKEIARMEKQRDKAARKMQRKTEDRKDDPPAEPETGDTPLADEAQ